MIREARRRQRRRRLSIGLLCVVAVGGSSFALHNSAGGGAAADHRPAIARPASPGSQPAHLPPIPRRLDTALLLWEPTASYVDDLSSRRVTSRAPIVNRIGYGDFQPLASVVGNRIVFVGDGLSSVGHGLTGQPRSLARTSSFAPAAQPDHVWAISTRHGRSVARALSVPAGVPGRSIVLPRDTALVRGTRGGLLLEAYQVAGSLELWHPGSTPRLLPHSARWADGFAATRGLVAFGTGCRTLSPHANYEPTACTMLRVFNVSTGRTMSYASPRGTLGWVPFEFNLVDAINRTGGYLAAEAAVSPQHAHRGRLYTVRLRGSNHRPTTVPQSTGSVRARVAWSVHGGWLLYQGPTKRLWAYQERTGRVRASTTPCCSYTVMAAVTSAR